MQCVVNNITLSCQGDIPKRDLMNAMWKKRIALMENILFHQDNAPVHKTSTMELFDLLRFPLLCHPPYSPDLAPCDFAIFWFLKKELRGTHHDSIDKLKVQAVINMCSFRESFFQTFQNWVHRHERCIEHKGHSFEKVELCFGDWTGTDKDMCS